MGKFQESDDYFGFLPVWVHFRPNYLSQGTLEQSHMRTRCHKGGSCPCAGGVCGHVWELLGCYYKFLMSVGGAGSSLVWYRSWVVPMIHAVPPSPQRNLTQGTSTVHSLLWFNGGMRLLLGGGGRLCQANLFIFVVRQGFYKKSLGCFFVFQRPRLQCIGIGAARLETKKKKKYKPCWIIRGALPKQSHRDDRGIVECPVISSGSPFWTFLYGTCNRLEFPCRSVFCFVDVNPTRIKGWQYHGCQNSTRYTKNSS